MAASTTVPPQYAGLVADAAVLPPREAPLEEAVRDHREAREAPYADLLGAFLVDDRRLPALVGLLGEDQSLDLRVVVSGGAGSLEPAVRRLADRPAGSPRLTGVEVALRDLDDLAGNARRVVAATRAARGLPEDTPVYVELPLTHRPDPTASPDWLAALDEVAAADLRLTLRTAGSDPSAFPTAATLAAAVDAALDREVPFSCTAGLHHAVRHRAGDTGVEHHGFLNLLLATAATWEGAARDEVTRLLEERDSGIVAAAAAATGSDLARARRWFTSFGCCAVTDPLGDLLALGLLPRVI